MFVYLHVHAILYDFILFSIYPQNQSMRKRGTFTSYSECNNRHVTQHVTSNCGATECTYGVCFNMNEYA